MRLLHKKHKWQGRETWLGLELDEPKRDMMIIEGRFLLKIGEESYPKAGFKLSPDEARALRDSLNEGLRIHDQKLRELMNESLQKSGWEESNEEPVEGFGSFMESGEEEKEGDEYKLFKPKKPSREETEFYY
jgi:hypothetical protein